MALRRTWLRDVLLSDDGQPLANTSVALLDQRGSVMAESAVGAAAGEWLPATFVIGARLSGDAQIFQTEGRDGIERIFALAPLYERSEEHTSELQSLMRISYAVFCLKKKKQTDTKQRYNTL